MPFVVLMSSKWGDSLSHKTCKCKRETKSHKCYLHLSN